MIDPVQPTDDAFIDQLRSMRPISVPNVQETFYRTGWEAAMRQHSKVHSLAPVAPKPRVSFSWGLMSGLATGVVSMLSIQSIDFVRNSDHSVQGETSVNVENSEPYNVDRHSELKSSVAAAPNDSAKELSHRLFVTADSAHHSQSIIQQREDLLDELSGSQHLNWVSKLAMHYSEPMQIDDGEPESYASLRNVLLDEEMQQLLRRASE